MTRDLQEEAHRLFDELIDLAPAARAARIEAFGPDEPLAREVSSLLAASDAAGDFLGVLGASGPRTGVVVAGRYCLERHLGSGAMGDVHLAWDRQLERPVALKFLRAPSASASPAALAPGLAEARAAARLEHPHVGTVYDVGESERGQRFIAMAYYPGETLKARLAHGPLPSIDALRVAAQVAGALAVAHAAGIVHCDVKPANVLFDAEGGARLADFGVARLLADGAAAPGSPAGTRAYMSPEQARGDAVHAAADLWALGVMLHEMLTGRRPHAAASGDDPEASLDAGLAPPVRALVAAMLAPDPRRRPPDAATVRRALDALIDADAPARRGLPTDAPALGGASGTLPHPATSLVGRERELAEARRLLDGTQLLTLTGPGGTGKTRLALELAAAVRESYADGAWFVPLAEVAHAALVPSAVARTLGVRDLGVAPLRDRVLATLGRGRRLLVLDNFEHVLDAALFVADILATCPGVTLLVTSRAPLGVQGEQRVPVPPLATPTHAGADIAGSEAVRLFVSRARAVRPSFALDDASLPVVAELCRRLDGLPLALELAAARAKLLSPRALLARLAHGTDLLRADGADRPARHGTMRAVIDWSYVLLSDAERALFCRLAVFAGGVSLDAAERVAALLEPDGDAPRPALDLLESLCDKSLLQHDDQADGEPRFSMLETVREFGLERLAAGADEAAARRAHRACCVALAERAAERLRGPEQSAWLDRLDRDSANFRAAFESALAAGAPNGIDPEALTDAARLAVALHRLWLTRGPLLEAIATVDRALAAADAPGAPPLDPTLHARLISSAAHLAGARSVFPEARALFARSLACYRRVADRAGTATTLNNLAWQVWNVGDLAEGEALSREAMAIHESLGDALGIALSRNNLAWIALERGEFTAAEAHFEAVIASHRARRDARGAASAMSWLGVLEGRRGAHRRAVGLHEAALEVGGPVADLGYRTLVLVRLAAAHHALGDAGDHVADVEHTLVPALRDFGRLWPLAYGLTELGAMLLEAGEVGRARAVLEEALDAWRATGAAGGATESRLRLGVARHRAGDGIGANLEVRAALAAARDYGARPLAVECLDALAWFAIDEGCAERGATLIAAAARAADSLGIDRAPRARRAHELLRAAVREALVGECHDAAWARGEALTFDETVALGLASAGPNA